MTVALTNAHFIPSPVPQATRETPHSGANPHWLIYQVTKGNKRPDHHYTGNDTTENKYCHLYSACWDAEPDLRPSAEDVIMALNSLQQWPQREGLSGFAMGFSFFCCCISQIVLRCSQVLFSLCFFFRAKCISVDARVALCLQPWDTHLAPRILQTCINDTH